MKNKTTKPFVDFYMRHGVIPTRQDISNLRRHLERRSALYRLLGVVPAWLEGKSVLEFGPGSGHNAVHTLRLRPARYVAVDANRASLASTAGLVRRHRGWTKCRIVDCGIEDFRTKEKFDLVLCEAVVPTQIRPAGFTRHLARFVRPGGVLVVTCMDPVSVLPEILRRHQASRVAPVSLPFGERVQKLTRFFQPHLRTLKDMSRKPEDWVIDVVIHPWTGGLFSMAEAIRGLKNIGIPLGSSPRFLSDWRWYKSIYGNHQWDSWEAQNSYEQHLHCFIDHRSLPIPQAAGRNRRLVAAATAIYEMVYGAERQGRVCPSSSLQSALRRVIAQLPPSEAAAKQALRDYCQCLGSDPRVSTGTFPSLWGRGQQYLSFVIDS